MGAGDLQIRQGWPSKGEWAMGCFCGVGDSTHVNSLSWRLDSSITLLYPSSTLSPVYKLCWFGRSHLFLCNLPTPIATSFAPAMLYGNQYISVHSAVLLSAVNSQFWIAIKLLYFNRQTNKKITTSNISLAKFYGLPKEHWNRKGYSSFEYGFARKVYLVLLRVMCLSPISKHLAIIER